MTDSIEVKTSGFRVHVVFDGIVIKAFDKRINPNSYRDAKLYRQGLIDQINEPYRRGFNNGQYDEKL